jgi:hypothetical protein
MNNGKSKLYYAHSKIIYDTDLEKEQLKLINNKFPDYEIINPNGNFVFSGMMACYYMIQACDMLIFSALDDFVGKGVYSEIEFAQRNGIKILCLKNEKFYEKIAVKIFDSQDWKCRYAKVKILKR